LKISGSTFMLLIKAIVFPFYDADTNKTYMKY
jgi:hypothetical protein